MFIQDSIQILWKRRKLDAKCGKGTESYCENLPQASPSWYSYSKTHRKPLLGTLNPNPNAKPVKKKSKSTLINWGINKSVPQSRLVKYKNGKTIKQNQHQISMSRVQGLSMTLHPDRLNPEFIGIGEKYSEHKRSRQDSDRHRKTIESNYAFTLKLNQQLERNLSAKEKELERLQDARQRHHQDINHKLSEEQRKEKELRDLKARSKEQRLSIKRGIKNVRESLKSDRLANKIATKEQLGELVGHFKLQKQAQKHQKCLKHKSVELGKKLGNERVNSYYRHKNLQSYNNYLEKIQEEDQRSDQNFQSIKKMHSNMKKLEKRIQKKQDKLKEVMEEINMYAVECQNQRKANFLATVSVFRPSSTEASWRSRPTDILRTSVNRNKNEETI